VTGSAGPGRWARVSELFETASGLPASARPLFLDSACGGDAALRTEVESLLACDLPDDPALDIGVRRALDGVAAEIRAAAPAPDRIGPYRVLSRIGEGGMGTVYLAERDGDPPVAVKVIRGLIGEDGLRRFRAERQMLASLQHPGIARLLDGGTTGGGLPYLVMEHVDGVPIDEYCARQALGVTDRIHLFRRVCDAVSHAHRSLVVHRDIKPSNILVAADGSPKLLDFGVAKLLSGDGTDADTPTAPSRRLLTPDYASPEQLHGSGPITTSADVYSLGVLLCELVTGTRPEALSTPGLKTPSTPDLKTPGMAAPKTRPARPIANGRGASAGRVFRPGIAGDLGTIVRAALEEDPLRRYASVDHLSADLQRYLERRPILARPSTWTYRAVRFVRRNRTATAVAAMFAIVVVGFAIALTISARRAARERDAAERVTAVLVRLLSGPDGRVQERGAATARDLVDRGVEQVRRDLRDQPALQARLFETLGAMYAGLGLVDRAEAVLQESMQAGRAAGGADSQAGARTMWRLAEALRERGRYAEAEPLAQAAYDMSVRLVGARNPQSAQMINTLGMILYARGRQAEAVPMFQHATAIFRETLGPDHPIVAAGLANSAMSLRDRGDLAGAEALAREALTLRNRMFGQALAETERLLAQVAGNGSVPK